MKKNLLPLAFIFISFFLNAQPAIQWSKNYGGSQYEVGTCIKATKDGGYIMCGSTASNDSDVTKNYGNVDCWVVKINSIGQIEWQKNYGGSLVEEATSISPTTDGGYIVAGATNSNDSDVVGYHPGTLVGPTYDIWVFKIDSVGKLQWQKTLGGTSNDAAHSIIQTLDKGYIVVGESSSKNGDVVGNHAVFPYNSDDAWIVKLDSLGNIQWSKCYGGTDDDGASDVLQTKDSNYVFCGNAKSINGDVTNNYGNGDVWVVKINSIGQILWQKNYGGSMNDATYSISSTNNNGFVVVGQTQSNDIDVSGNHGNVDAWIFRIDSIGNLQWQKCLGGSEYDQLQNVKKTIEGGFVAIGVTQSNDGDVSGLHSSQDAWTVKLDSSGNLQWEKCLGGTSGEWGMCIEQTNNGGFVTVNTTNSQDGDVLNNFGSYDFWIVKLATDPLPLQITNYFLRQTQRNKIENIWQTANEINVSHFNVQSSKDGKKFNNIGQLKANNKNLNNYLFADYKPQLETNEIVYYRIEAVDKDGNIHYSETKQLAIGRAQNTINIFPNPATDFVTIETQNAKQLLIIDFLGNIIKQVNYLLEPQSQGLKQKITINTKQYTKGVYYIKAYYNNGTFQIEKLLVQ